MKKLERVHELRGRFQNWSNAMRSSATTHMTGKFVKYVFDDFGLLRDVNGNAYVYEAKSAENVGAHMAEQLYTLLQQEPFTLRKYFFDSRLGENGGFFFATEDIARNRNLVVLIHGRGAVRAGQWSRRLILSEGLAAGSQLEYIRQCRNRGWAVLVMNTNHNTVTNVWQLKPHAIKGSATAEEHGINVWQAVVAGSRARNIAIIAHSYGGKVAEEIDLSSIWRHTLLV